MTTREPEMPSTELQDGDTLNSGVAQSERLRLRLVAAQIAGRGVRDRRVLQAMREVPREAFVETGFEEFAYENAPLPIGDRQTIFPALHHKRAAHANPEPLAENSGRACVLPAARLPQSARSFIPVTPSCSAQCAQQNILPFASTPCPTMRHLQCAHCGAIAWIAHSKLSKVMVLLPCITRKALS
jgi:hypothetical protein